MTGLLIRGGTPLRSGDPLRPGTTTSSPGGGGPTMAGTILRGVTPLRTGYPLRGAPTATPPPVAPPVVIPAGNAFDPRGATFRIFDLDTGAYLGDLLDFTSLKASFEYSAIGSFTCDYPRLGRFSALLNTDIEIVAYFNGVEIRNGRWVIRGKSGDATSDDGGKITAAGLSHLDLLRKVLVYVPTTFNASTPGGLIKALLTTATTRGAFGATALTTATFNNTVDSKGAAWANVYTVTFDPGTTFRQILESLASRGLIDFEFNGRDLMVYNGGTMGSNKDLVLAAGRHVLETPYKMSTEDRANVVLVEGDNGVTVERTVSGPRREEVYTQQSGVSNSATLNVVGDLFLQEAATVTDQRTVKIAAASTIRPLRDFAVGDFVLYDDGLNPPASMRVRQIVLELDEDGQEEFSCILNDMILEGNVKRAIQLNAIAGGVGGGTTGTPSVPPATDTTVPSAPASVTVTSSTYVETNGVVYAQITVSWPAVTTNTDASTITDLDHYNVQYQSNQAFLLLPANQWSMNNIAPAGVTTTYFGPVRPGSQVTVRVSAADSSGHVSAWTTSAPTTVVSDTTPPNPPSTPTVDPFFHGVRVTWNGLDNAGNAMPGDWLRTEVHASATSGFTPSPSTYVDALFTRGGSIPVLDLPVNTPYFVKLVAYDTTGNASTPSTQASATTEQLSDPDLPAKLVAGAKIADKTVSVANLTVGAFTDNMAPNANMDALDTNSRPMFWTNVGSVQGAGSLALVTADTTTPIAGTTSMKVSPTATASVEVVSDALTLTPTEIYYVKAEIRTSRVLAGGGIVELAVYTHTAVNVIAGTRTSVTTSTGGTTSFSIEGSFTAPAGHKFMGIALWAKTDTGGAYDATFDDIELRKIVGTANIANASINNAKIANLAVDDAKIASLAAGKITTGTLSADIILGAKIRTATSGNRVDISGIGVEMYRGTFRTVWIRPDVAQVRVYNDADATLTSTAHGFQAGDDSGFNLIIDNNEIMARNNSAASLLLLNKDSGDVYIGNNTLYPTNPYTTGAARFNNQSAYITVPLRIWGGGNQVDPANENPPLLVGDSGGTHIQMDDLVIQAVNGDVESPIKINPFGGYVELFGQAKFEYNGGRMWWHPATSVSGNRDISIQLGDTTIYSRDFTGSNTRDISCRTLFQTSGRSSKANIVDISDQDPLPALSSVKVYQYELLDDAVAPINGNPRAAMVPSGRKQIGPMAEDLMAVNPDLVQNFDDTGLAVNVASMLGMLFLAGKRLREGLQNVRGRTSQLEADVAAIKSRIGMP